MTLEIRTQMYPHIFSLKKSVVWHLYSATQCKLNGSELFNQPLTNRFYNNSYSSCKISLFVRHLFNIHIISCNTSQNKYEFHCLLWWNRLVSVILRPMQTKNITSWAYKICRLGWNNSLIVKKCTMTQSSTQNDKKSKSKSLFPSLTISQQITIPTYYVL